VAFGSTKVPETIKAINYCQKLVKFYDTIYLTDSIITESNIRHILIKNIPSIKEYQKFIVYESPEIILSNVDPKFSGHFLCINWDGFIVNPDAWRDEFLEYDYIGAPWPWFNHMVGNGGFCLKSKQFLSCQKTICEKHNIQHNEDVELCIVLRQKFESLGCKYANSKIGYTFSTEVGDININNSFGFHDFKYHTRYKHIVEVI
jgi:hypothetical protein